MIFVMLFRYELKERCTSLISKDCDIGMGYDKLKDNICSRSPSNIFVIAVTKEVPEQRCEQVILKKCETHYDLVKEETYKVECNVKLGKGFITFPH